MENWKVNKTQITEYSEVVNKKRNKEIIRTIIIFVVSLIGISISIAGYSLGLWGRGIDFLFFFLTYQANIIIVFYYGAKTISYFYNKDFYEKISKVGYHGAATSYIALVGFIIIGLVVPYRLISTEWDIVWNNIQSRGGILGILVRDGIVHIFIPIMVVYDFLRTKHNQEDIQAMSKKILFFWSIYIFIYLVFIITLSLTTGIYLYPIVDFELMGWWMLIFDVGSIFMYLGLSGILYYIKKRQLKKLPKRDKALKAHNS